ncbi:hypothetical protein EDB92DRAFT_376931 [Lactarius akahatsu]|uniref:Secreted protein n=1 Tax=Lactarius akahatsu TaxID=416441 RepID=A0AAD4LMD4_9AGAM|nr:hypothetical protein EDB92DRAFT_376931 [Lactarius akahatsu]
MSPKVCLSLAKTSGFCLLIGLCCLDDQAYRVRTNVRGFLVEGPLSLPFESKLVRVCCIPGNEGERMGHITGTVSGGVCECWSYYLEFRCL